MTDSIEVNTDKDLGLVVTPPQTAKYMVGRLAPFKDDERILDPCTGPGVFVNELIKIGVSERQIHAFDINAQHQENFSDLKISFEVKDYLLSINPFSRNQFDVIVGNPPYLNKGSNYIKKNRKSLKKIYGKINAHETYAMFIVNSIWRLKNGGRLGFITSDSFLTLKTHQRLRKFILNTCKIKEILLPPANLFDEQDVSTSPAILLLEKCAGKDHSEERLEHNMRIIPRLQSEEEYEDPPKILSITQKNYVTLPYNIFYFDIEEGVIEMFQSCPKLKTVLRGYIGMHTHNNRKYIAAIEGTELAEIFNKRNEKITKPAKKYKIISKEELKSEKWVPYLKRGGSEQYFRPIMEALNWEEESIPIYDIPKRAPFKKEGVVISGVSSRLAARYMPPDCYWDTNKAMGFIIQDKSLSIEYFLGLLNSSLYNYLMKGIINNTNSIQLSGLHALPFFNPSKEIQLQIEELVKHIIQNLKEDKNYDYVREQKELNKVIFNFHQQEF